MQALLYNSNITWPGKPCLDVSLFIKIDTTLIWFVKFILEGYDGLALLTTINKDEGIVRLRVHPSRYKELVLLLNALASTVKPGPTQ